MFGHGPSLGLGFSHSWERLPTRDASEGLYIGLNGLLVAVGIDGLLDFLT